MGSSFVAVSDRVHRYQLRLDVIFCFTQPRNLPTARITYSSSAPSAFVYLPSWLIPFLFFLPRLLSILPAVFGTLWNVYHIIWPPGGSGPEALAWRVDYFVSVLWVSSH